MIQIERPTGGIWLPLVFDSPHSGSQYPDDFDHALDRQILRRSEDAFVEDLFASVPLHGGSLLHAQFPRCYIDPNRALHDVDVSMLDGPWPDPVVASGKQARGAGLIWRSVKRHGDIYARTLGVAEVQARIANCWQPYHQALGALLDEACARAGFFIHIDCHSMASMGDHTTEDGAVARPDFILGDLDGAACAPALTDEVAGVLRKMGYSVVLNHPYKGQELVRRYSSPPAGRHSLQIEINRALYMDETRIEPNAGYELLQRNLDTLVAHLAKRCERMAGQLPVSKGNDRLTESPR